MAKGYGGMQGMNMGNLMKQAQKMQAQMQKTQEELEQKAVEVTAGGGAVKVVMNGKKVVQSIKISPDVIDPDDVEMLEDLVTSSINEASRQIDEMTNSEMSKLTGGMGLPPGGLF